MVRGRWAIAGVLALAMLAAACGSDDKDDTGSQSQATPAGGQAAATQAAATQQAVNIKRGGTLNVALSNNPKTFDPMLSNDVPSSAITVNVFEGLYKYDEQQKPVPWLAEKVDISSDNTTYTFTLRKGIKFHDGTEMDGEAVKFSMDRVRNNPASVRYSDVKDVTDIAVVDKYTVKVTLAEPFAPFPSRLTGGAGSVVSPAAVKAMGDEQFGLKPVGTGPYKFGEWRNDVSVRVDKFADYWRDGADGKKLPYMDRVEWKIITEATTRLTALQTGDVDISALRELDLPIAKKDPNIAIMEGPGFGWGGFWLTINKPPFDNKALRQAVAYAVDRDEINKTIYEGTRQPMNGPIPPILPWAIDPNFKPYPATADPEKAKQKLTEGGRPSGFEFEYWISSGDQTAQQLAELLQAQLAKVGIKMNIQTGDFNGVVVPKLTKQESNAYQIVLTGGVDPDQHVSAFLTGAGFNYFPYSNPQVDDLIKRGRAISNIEERAKIYKDMVRLIMDDAPYIYTLTSIDRFSSRKSVKGGYVGSKATAGYSEFWKE